jgi:FAD/FMN-containing dehydrogenase
MPPVAESLPSAASPPLDEHRRKVEEVAARVRDLVGRGEPVHIHKGGVHHVVPLPNDPRFNSRPIDVSSLRHVLSIDRERRECVAEPGVTFAEVVQATLAQGLLPTVVPELTGITLGGAVAGCSVESMSYRVGGFHDSCLEYEVVTGDGRILSLDREREPLAFEMVHGSYGTLAILTRLRFRLVDAQPFVRLEYRKFRTAEAFDEAMRARITAGDYDFIDAIVHDPTTFVLCLGRFVETAPYVSSYRWLDIFYKSTRARDEDYLTTFDYCFRYDTECHWLTKTLPPLEWKPVRFAIGRFVLGSTNLIQWSKRLAPILGLKKRPDVVVDVFIPSRRFLDFWRWYERDFRFYPLWVIPYRIPKMYPWLNDDYARRMGEELFYDCAVYGKPNGDPGVDWSQVLEEKTHELDGIKTLISRNHYSAEQFWTVYNQPNYQAAKAQLDPRGVFKGLFEKFHRVE